MYYVQNLQCWLVSLEDSFLMLNICMSLYFVEFVKFDDNTNVNILGVNWRKCCRRIIDNKTQCNSISELMC